METVPISRPWAAWCWLASDDPQSSDNLDVSKELRELAWVQAQVSNVIEVSEIACNQSGELVTDEFRTTGKTSSAALPMIGRPMQRSLIRYTPPSTIFLASFNRSDPIERAAGMFKTQYPDAALRVVLGEWWAGHRRTWPISKQWASVYWYQCHDVLLPELLMQCDTWRGRKPTTRMALVVSADSSIRQLWLEILPQLGFQALAASNVDELPEGKVDVVFYDRAFTDLSCNFEGVGETDESMATDASSVSVLRKTFPDSKIVACFGFPRWNEVHRCIESGADIILGKPFQMDGLSTMLAQWLPT